MTGDDRVARQEFREFVRAHHPDRGGDPDVFVAGLARLRAVDGHVADGMAARRWRVREAHRASQGGQPTIYKRRSLVYQAWVDVLAALRDVVVPRSSRVR